MYDFWVSTERKVLPHAGGFLDQPAPVMAVLRLLDTKHRIWEHIARIEEKSAEEVRLLEKADARRLKEELGLG